MVHGEVRGWQAGYARPPVVPQAALARELGNPLVFSTTLSDVELRSCKGSDRQDAPDRAKFDHCVFARTARKGQAWLFQSLPQILESFSQCQSGRGRGRFRSCRV